MAVDLTLLETLELPVVLTPTWTFLAKSRSHLRLSAVPPPPIRILTRFSKPFEGRVSPGVPGSSGVTSSSFVISGGTGTVCFDLYFICFSISSVPFSHHFRCASLGCRQLCGRPGLCPVLPLHPPHPSQVLTWRLGRWPELAKEVFPHPPLELIESPHPLGGLPAWPGAAGDVFSLRSES